MGQYAGFEKVKLTRPKRSTFDLTHDRRMSIQVGTLTPIMITECVPSDTFSGSTEMLARLAPLLAPIYDQVHIYTHFFFVPNRLLWENWEEFITGGRLGVGIDPVNAPVPPWLEIEWGMNNGTVGPSSLGDYLGVPSFPGAALNYDGIQIDAMPFLAYELIYEHYYNVERNFTGGSGLEDNFPVPDGSIHAAWPDGVQLRLRGYRQDYFTSALPFTQRGEEVMIPVQFGLSGYAPVVTGGDGSINYWELDATIQPGGGASTRTVDVDTNAPNPGGTASDLFADLGNTANPDTGIVGSINDFRSAYALQVWLERNAIGGSRYTESTQAHFGVRPQDARLQRPEYIGGGLMPIRISEVVATAFSQNEDTDTVPQGNMAGHGAGYGDSNRFKYFCTEHGFIMGIVSVMTPATYYQGLPRMFRRKSFLDYPWPTFAKLGEQEVHKYEIYADPTTLTEDAETGAVPMFGYQSRYADWKFIPNTLHGDFRSTLLFWTAARTFEDPGPELGPDFLKYDENGFDAMFAVAYNRPIWLYVHNKLMVKRPLPYFGTPNTLGFS